MKQIYLLVFIFFSFTYQNNSDLTVIKHSNFTTTFSKSKNYPVYVEWWVTKDKLNCSNPLKRENSFKADPKFNWDTKFNDDYLNSGYDRGHMCPAADNLCMTKNVLEESFFFTNISPQQHALNSGDWLTLEEYTRDLARSQDSIQVFCGNIGEIKKIKSVSVPEYCWKVIYIKKKGVWEAYLFSNNKSKANGIKDNKVDIKKIEKLTGFNFSK